jgi:hypothetical protein
MFPRAASFDSAGPLIDQLSGIAMVGVGGRVCRYARRSAAAPRCRRVQPAWRVPLCVKSRDFILALSWPKTGEIGGERGRFRGGRAWLTRWL